MRTVRCCMCPNINNPSNQICPSGGPQNKKETICDFVLTFIDENNFPVFISNGIASDNKTWFTVRKKTVWNGIHRVKTKALPERKQFDEAQTDLNMYAQRKGWKNL